MEDVNEHHQMSEEMQFYVMEIARAREEERKHIAHELHDGIVQDLATLSLDIEAIIRANNELPQKTSKSLKQLQASVYSIMEQVRRFSYELRPDILDRLGLVPALEVLTDELGKELNARFVTTGAIRRLPPNTELALFRIAQEALRNVRKHARATETVVKVDFVDHKVYLSVSDNGRGFEVPDDMDAVVRGNKLGLLGMRERALLLGGSFSLQSQPGKGTRLRIEVGGKTNFCRGT